MLFIFDLDFTLWDCGGTWCDHTTPPYKKLNNNLIVDNEERYIKLYPSSLAILRELQKKQVQMALASRTGGPEIARHFLQLFKIDHFFTYKEIYPNSKIVHFNSIQKQSGFSFSEMFFFDDEYRNIDEVSSLGVNCYLVEDGINTSLINKAFEKHEKNGG